jgi:hypothetical protein
MTPEVPYITLRFSTDIKCLLCKFMAAVNFPLWGEGFTSGTKSNTDTSFDSLHVLGTVL